MNKFGEISNNFTFRQTVKQVDDYWLVQASDKTIYEYLFQGTCNIKSMTYKS